jgi:hypothetical protein
MSLQGRELRAARQPAKLRAARTAQNEAPARHFMAPSPSVLSPGFAAPIAVGAGRTLR